MQADSAQWREEGVSGRSPLSTPGCQRAFCTVVLSSIHEFISYWDRDNRISAASILESVGGWRGGALTLSRLHTMAGCVHVWMTCAIVWVCIVARQNKCSFHRRKQHFLPLSSSLRPPFVSRPPAGLVSAIHHQAPGVSPSSEARRTSQMHRWIYGGRSC